MHHIQVMLNYIHSKKGLNTEKLLFLQKVSLFPQLPKKAKVVLIK